MYSVYHKNIYEIKIYKTPYTKLKKNIRKGRNEEETVITRVVQLRYVTAQRPPNDLSTGGNSRCTSCSRLHPGRSHGQTPGPRRDPASERLLLPTFFPTTRAGQSGKSRSWLAHGTVHRAGPGLRGYRAQILFQGAEEDETTIHNLQSAWRSAV